MRKLICALSFCTFLACSSSQSQSKYEEIIREYLETDKMGVKTDLAIEFEPIVVSDITVQDSIDIISAEFEIEKAKRIESREASIKRYESRIAEHKERAKSDWTAEISVKDQTNLLKNEKEALERIKNSTSEKLEKYDNQEPSKIIAKKAVVSYSLMNPKLQSRQTYENAVFVLSADGTKCLKMEIPDYLKKLIPKTTKNKY